MNVGDLVHYNFSKKKRYTGVLLKIKRPDEKYYSGVTQIPLFVIKMLDLNGRICYYDIWDTVALEVVSEYSVRNNVR